MICVVTWFLAPKDFNLLNYKEMNFLNNLELLHRIHSTSGFWKIKGDGGPLLCAVSTTASLFGFPFRMALVFPVIIDTGVYFRDSLIALECITFYQTSDSRCPGEMERC